MRLRRNVLSRRHMEARCPVASWQPTIHSMMQDDLIRRLHDSPWCGVLAITGGGSGAIERLLSVPGASGTVLEALVPYSSAALTEWLRATPSQACSEATARAMAMRAYERAGELEGGSENPIERFGVGCTASLASDRPKRGEHRAHVAVQTGKSTRVVTLRFEKGRRSRAEEEQATAHTVLAALAATAGVHEIDLSKTPPGLEAESQLTEAPAAWAELLAGGRESVELNGAASPEGGEVCLLPGSFNPVHEGHLEMGRLAALHTGRPVVLEMSITNVDKPPLDFQEIEQRVESLAGQPLWLTSTPTFVEKAKLAPGALFAVGADTIERIGQPRYYGGDPLARDEALDQLQALGARFLVFGRAVDGGFQGVEDLDLPASLRSLCEGVPESEFRVDVSSTELRDAAG